MWLVIRSRAACVSRTIDGGPCYRHIELDGEHGRMAYVEVSREAGPTASELVVVEIDGTPVARVALPIATVVRSLDLRGDLVIVNRWVGDGFAVDYALMVDLRSGETIQLRDTGDARFLRSAPMTVPGVISPGMAARRGWPLVDILLATDDGVSSVTAEGVITEHLVGGTTSMRRSMTRCGGRSRCLAWSVQGRLAVPRVGSVSPRTPSIRRRWRTSSSPTITSMAFT